MKKILALVVGCGSLFVVGCCGNGTSSKCPPPPPRLGEVGGALVYRLGGGITANSSAVKLAGSQSCCPAPAAAANCGFPASAPVFMPSPSPCAPTPAPRPEPMALPAPAVGCSFGGCPPSAFTSVVCAPGENLGECVTLPDGGGTGGVDIYVPNGGALEKLTDALSKEPSEASGAPAKAESDAAVSAPPAKAEEPAAVKAEEFSEKPAAGSADKAAVVESAAVPVTPPALPAGDDMPPVFREGTTDRAADEVLSSAGQTAPAEVLPRVELPPELK